MDINTLRKQIDEEDENLIKSLEKRFHIVKKIGEIKKQLQVSIEDKERFEEVLRSRKEMAKKMGISEEFINKLFNLIHDEAVDIEEKQ